MPIESLADRHCLVIGGSSGMGYAAAAYLLASKCVVTITGRDPAKLEAARERMLADAGASPDRLRAVAGDGRDADHVEAAVALAARASGEIDGAFVVAGAGGFSPVVETTTQFAADMFAVNVFPLINVIRSAAPRMMQKGGSIVALSSTAGYISYPKLGAYGAAKSALDHYVRVAADELGPHQIRVNAVRSGFTNSGGSVKLIEDEAYVRRFAELTPLGPYAKPEAFGPMVGLLLSPDTAWITGQTFSIDGGLSLRGYAGGVFPSGMG
jgi:NAD(P)-dependent dehydrogenase (short-subunit alcohol dehydrogenase family)